MAAADAVLALAGVKLRMTVSLVRNAPRRAGDVRVAFTFALRRHT